MDKFKPKLTRKSKQKVQLDFCKHIIHCNWKEKIFVGILDLWIALHTKTQN